MRIKSVFLIIVIVFWGLLPLSYAEEIFTIHAAYCDHMGYNVELDENKIPLCVFEDGTSCTTWSFYSGECRNDKVKDTPLVRSEGQFVYLEFEKCAEDLTPTESKYLLEPLKCVKLSLFSRFLGWFGF